MDPLLVLDKTIKKCDIYFDSPDLSSNADGKALVVIVLTPTECFQAYAGIPKTCI